MGKTVDVVVIGAGLAGLMAARDLVRDGYDVVVLEARGRVGGRILNAELPGGGSIEIGGQWVGPGQHRVHALIKELGLSTYPSPTQGRHVAEFGGARRTYTGRIPAMNPLTLVDVGQIQARLDRLARKIPVAEPWLAPHADELDAQTFATWLNRVAWTPGGRSFFRLLTQAVFAADPEDMSALWAAFYIGGGGGVDNLISVEGGSLQDRVEGGSQRIALALAEQLADRVLLDSVVSHVDWDEQGVRVTAGDQVIRARHAVIALPPPLISRIRFTPNLPNDRDQLAQRMASGRVIKVNVVYERAFWREQGFSGQANSDTRPLGTVFENTPLGGSPAVLVGFLEGHHGDVAARLSPTDRQAQVIEDLVGYFGEGARHPIRYIEQDWAAEEFSGGGYHAFTTPGALTSYGHALRTPIGPIHWAGSETAIGWAGFMEGAIQSGERAAQEILKLDRRA